MIFLGLFGFCMRVCVHLVFACVRVCLYVGVSASLFYLHNGPYLQPPFSFCLLGIVTYVF